MTNEELKKLANENRELQEQLVTCQRDLEDSEERHLVRTRKLREEMRDQHDKHKLQLAILEASHKVSQGSPVRSGFTTEFIRELEINYSTWYLVCILFLSSIRC